MQALERVIPCDYLVKSYFRQHHAIHAFAASRTVGWLSGKEKAYINRPIYFQSFSVNFQGPPANPGIPVK